MIRSCIAIGATILAALPAPGQIPATDGQVWQAHDLKPFTSRAGPGSERHVVDWILQDTGYAAWHGTMPACLSATADAVSCFHTPDMQARVADVVERFTGDAQTPHRFSLRVFGVGSPAWRGDVRPVLRPIPAATPGVQAWVMSREDAAVVVGRLRGRADCQELPTGAVLAANGIPAVLSGGRTLPYPQDVAARPEAWPGWQVQTAACGEGFAIDVHPLLLRDGSAVDAILRCRIDQIERLAPVALASPSGDPGGVRVAVPQVAAVRVGERLRWPATHSLLVSLGLVPWPVPAQNGAGVSLVGETKRRDVIVVVEPRLRGGP